MKEKLKDKKIKLFTSDCGLNSAADFNEQELNLSILNLSQSLAALTILSDGGNAVVKTFLPMAESLNVSITYLMYLCFEKVSIVKQSSGSPRSSEVYVVCENLINRPDKKIMDKLFNFLDNFELKASFLPQEAIPKGFLDDYIQIMSKFAKKQQNELLKSFYYYNNRFIFKKHLPLIEKAKLNNAKNWVERMDIKKLNDDEYL